MDSRNATHHAHQASLCLSYVYLPRPLTPHDEQDSQPLNKLNHVTILSRKRTNRTCTIQRLHYPHRLILPWPGPGGDVWTKQARTLGVGGTSLRVLLPVRTRTRTSKEAMNPLCEKDGLICEMNRAVRRPRRALCGSLVNWNQLELMHWNAVGV